MVSSLKAYGLEVRQSLAAFFGSLPWYFRERFIWWLLLAPVLLVVLVYFLSDANIFGWQHQRTQKGHMEVLHPCLLAASVLLSLFGWLRSKDAALGLLAAVCSACFGRELAGQGTSIYLALGLIICIWYAHTRRQQIATLLQSRWALAFVAMGFINYALSQLLDRGVIRGIGRLITQSGGWQPPYASNLEESLESLGGLFLLLAATTLFSIVSVSKAQDV